MARLFFALWPPRETAQALAAWAKEVARRSGGRPVPAERIHLTLAFLGEAEADRAAAAAALVRAAAFDLPLDTRGYWRHNKIVWAAPARAPDSLQRLVTALQLELYRAEFILARRPFAAHVTLVRKSGGTRAFPDLPLAGWPVREFTLMSSTLSAKGSAYVSIARFGLAGTTPGQI